MSAGYVGILSAEFHFPESGSLKEKRKEIKSVRTQLSQKFCVAVAEVDHHELWQRSQLTVSCVGRTYNDTLERISSVENFLLRRSFEVFITRRDVGKVDDWPS